MKITLEAYKQTYTFEDKSDDYEADELKEIFSRLLVSAGYSPEVIDPRDGGRYECTYIPDEEERA